MLVIASGIQVQFASGTKLLGSQTFTEAAGGSAFVGVAAASLAITSVLITWASEGDADTFVSNIAFGTP